MKDKKIEKIKDEDILVIKSTSPFGTIKTFNKNDKLLADKINQLVDAFNNLNKGKK